MQDHLFVYVWHYMGTLNAILTEPISRIQPPKYSLEGLYLGVYYIASKKGS